MAAAAASRAGLAENGFLPEMLLQVRPLAAGAKLRAVLRVPRRRHQPVASRPVYDNHQVEPPRTPDEGYHLTEDLADKAIEFVADAKQVAPNKPFYPHFCAGATHAPHHVPREWADRYAGQFDDGWDAYRQRVFARQKELGVMSADAELSRHDPDVPDWESLSPEARRLPIPPRTTTSPGNTRTSSSR